MRGKGYGGEVSEGFARITPAYAGKRICLDTLRFC